MVSLNKCRELLGEEGLLLSDDELAVTREEIYSLAALMIDAATNRTRKSPLRLVSPQTADSSGQSFKQVLNLVDDYQKDAIEERAAIIEYEAKLSRDEAERAAIVLTLSSREDEEG